MTTEIQNSLVERNAVYAGKFTKGDLPLPPGKKYIICKHPRPNQQTTFKSIEARCNKGQDHAANKCVL